MGGSRNTPLAKFQRALVVVTGVLMKQKQLFKNKVVYFGARSLDLSTVNAAFLLCAM
jgi:hypothetical protein